MSYELTKTNPIKPNQTQTNPISNSKRIEEIDRENIWMYCYNIRFMKGFYYGF